MSEQPHPPAILEKHPTPESVRMAAQLPHELARRAILPTVITPSQEKPYGYETWQGNPWSENAPDDTRD